MTDHYDKDGNSITIEQWGKLLEIKDYKIIKQEVVGGFRVSTVWLGLNHNYGNGPPLIFETMIFPSDGYDDLWCERYSTLDEATAGHEKALEHAKTL